MADLATLGLAVDSSQLDVASRKLGDFAAAGKGAQQSSDSLSAAAARLSKQIELAAKNQIAYNDNVKQQSQTQNSTYWTETASKVGLAAAAFYGLISVVKAADEGMSRSSASMVSSFNAILMYLPNRISGIWKEGTDKLASYIKLSEQAGAFTTEFYQRIVKGAADAKISVDQLIKSLAAMQESLAPKLGGSIGQNKLDELTRAGNFRGNTGAGDLSRATDEESRLKAMVSFWQQALDINQRLAALEVIRVTMGEETVKALEKDSFYLEDIYKKSKAIEGAKLIDQSDIDRAVGLKIALDGAYKTISDIRARNQEVKPPDWSKWGIEIEANWTRLVTLYASALTWLDKIFSSTKKISELKPEQSAWDKFFTNFGQFFDDMTRAERVLEVAKLAAEQSLASQMQNPANMKRAGVATQTMADQLRGDESFATGAVANKKALDEITASIEKYISSTKLAISTIDMSAGEMKKAEVQAQLYAAAIDQGLSEASAKAISKLSGLGDAAKKVADDLDAAQKLKSARDAYKSVSEGIQSAIDASKLAIQTFGQSAGKIKEAEVNAQLYAALLRTGLTPELAAAAVAAAGLGKAAGDLADELERLNKVKVATDTFKAAIEGIDTYIASTKLAIQYHGKAAGALKEAEVQADLTAKALKITGSVSEEDATKINHLAKEAGGLATKLETLNKSGEKDFFKRAEETLQKYIETSKAAATTVDLGTAAQERARAVAQLTAAGIRDGLTPALAAARAELSKLPEAASIAAEALAKVKIAAEISFGAKTAFLSADDVAIATQLKGLYPDVATGLNSVYAAGLRTNTAIKGLSAALETNLTSGLTDIATGAKTASVAFADMGKAIIKAIDEMIIKMLIIQPLMKALQGSMGLFGFGGGGGGGGPIAGAIGPTSVGGAALSGYHTGGIIGSEATFSRYVHPAYFDNAPRFHSGGIAGNEIPIIAKKGEGVFTKGQMAAMGGGGTINAPVNINIDATGADAAGLARVENQLAILRTTLPATIVTTVQKAKSNRVL